jgi:hypothetical protein
MSFNGSGEPSDYYRDSDERYDRDPAFHHAVDMVQALAHQHGFTPGELKQIAFYAALKIEERRIHNHVIYLRERT